MISPKSAPVLTEMVERILKTPVRAATEAPTSAPLLTEMVTPLRKARARKVAAPVAVEYGTRVTIVPALKVAERKVAAPKHFAPAPAASAPTMQATIVATAAVPAAREVKQLNKPLPSSVGIQ